MLLDRLCMLFGVPPCLNQAVSQIQFHHPGTSAWSLAASHNTK